MFLLKFDISLHNQTIRKMDNIKRDLIKTIYVNEANFDYIRNNKIINGTLFKEIERIMEEYLKIKLKEQNEF